MRLLLSPKWMAWHVLTLGAMVTCIWLAIWQWERAGSAMGSALNVGYGLQWPLFAIFFGVMWWRFLRMEIADLRADQESEVQAEPTAPAAVGVGEPAGGTPAAESAVVATDDGPGRPSPFTARPAGVTAPPGGDPQLQAYNEELARLNARYQEETTP